MIELEYLSNLSICAQEENRVIDQGFYQHGDTGEELSCLVYMAEKFDFQTNYMGVLIGL